MESPTKKQKRFMQLPSFVDPDRIVQELLDEKRQPKRDFAVIDVRGDDFSGGNIKHAINIPSFGFENDIEHIYHELKEIPTLYFHCALSQVRGPKCAQKYVNFINQNDIHSNQQIFIVRGGYQEFQEHVTLKQEKHKLLENVSYGY